MYRLVSPKKAEADSEEVQAIIDGLATISATNVASPDTSEESLKKHGLDEPAGVIEFSIKGQEGKFKLSVSAKNEDGTRYALLDGTKAIFIINDSDVSAWLGRSVLSLQSTLNLMPQIETIKTMTITVDGEEYSFGWRGRKIPRAARRIRPRIPIKYSIRTARSWITRKTSSISTGASLPTILLRMRAKYPKGIRM